MRGQTKTLKKQEKEKKKKRVNKKGPRIKSVAKKFLDSPLNRVLEELSSVSCFFCFFVR